MSCIKHNIKIATGGYKKKATGGEASGGGGGEGAGAPAAPTPGAQQQQKKEPTQKQREILEKHKKEREEIPSTPRTVHPMFGLMGISKKQRLIQLGAGAYGLDAECEFVLCERNLICTLYKMSTYDNNE